MSTTTRPAARPAARRAPTEAQSRARARRTAARADALPGWDALAAPGARASGAKGRVARAGGRAEGGQRQAEQRAAAKRRVRALDVAPSLRAGLWTVLASVVLTLFISHSYATRHTLDALQEARHENERLRLTQRRLAGAFDRMTAPDRVMPRAVALGLVEGVAYGTTVTLDTEPTDPD